MKARFALLLFVLSLSWGQRAHAQANDGRARIAIRNALDALQNLDVDRANAQLQEANRHCSRRGACSTRIQAQVQMAVGIVAISGRNDNDAGIQAFTAALRLDSEVQLDPVIATPELTAAFNRARRALRGATGPVGQLLHDPVVEQISRTPIPVYIETGIQGAVRVDVNYRSVGGTTFTTLAMRRAGRGWAATIPCEAVTDTGLEYYVSAFDERDNPNAEAGSEESPLRVNIVTTRTRPAASLPGELPPQRCRAAGERAVVGESCAIDSDCNDGLHCHEHLCAQGASTNSSPTQQQRSWFEVDLGAGVGLAFLGGTPGYAEAQLVNPNMPMGPAQCVMVSCPAMPTGVAPTFFLSLTARFHILRFLAVAGSVRLQPDAATRTTLAPALLGLRAYFAVLPPGFARTGFVLAPFAGLGVGQIQPRPTTPSAERPNQPTGHIVTGLNNANFGARAEYGFGPGLRAGAEVTAQFQFPRFLFDLDLTAFFGWQY